MLRGFLFASTTDWRAVNQSAMLRRIPKPSLGLKRKRSKTLDVLDLSAL